MSDAEISLQGGRTTPAVVRVGQTVRRPPRLSAEFVHMLLEHMAELGFDGAPRFLGTDDKGRDILSYIEGEVPAELGWHKDEVLVAAARLIRRFHPRSGSWVTKPAHHGDWRSSVTTICRRAISSFAPEFPLR